MYVLTLPVLAFVAWRCVVRRDPALRFIAWVAFIVYLTEVASRTLFPLPVDPTLIAEMRVDQFGSHNWVPFTTIRTMLSHPHLSVRLVQIGGNLLLLLPLGYFLPLLFRAARRFSKAAAMILAATLTIEVMQLLISLAILGFAYKAFDVDDILLNLIGGLIGYALFVLLEPGIRGGPLDAPAVATAIGGVQGK